ncbi:hypothetical protein L4C38_04880 [Vibrio kasasachensis]|uniref:hypothetical protein n=1 Tax=Vibrio kasasachensis TaxID=2910248 RepID=UPI003D118AAF
MARYINRTFLSILLSIFLLGCDSKDAFNRSLPAEPISPGSIISIEIVTKNPQTSLKLGEVIQFEAQAKYREGHVNNITNEANWAISKPQIASIDNGKVVAKKYGNFDVHADLQGITASYPDTQYVKGFVSAAMIKNSFIVLDSEGSVVDQNKPYQADISGVSHLLNNIKNIYPDPYDNYSFGDAQGFAAVKQDGSVILFGNVGDTSSINAQLTNIKHVILGYQTGAVHRNDNTVISWGNVTNPLTAPLSNVKSVTANAQAFAAIINDNSVVTWGNANWGADSSKVQSELKNIKSVSATRQGAFAAINNNSRVISWGEQNAGGDSSSVKASLTNVDKIVGDFANFAALKSDGSIVLWGLFYGQPLNNAFLSNLTNVKDINAGELGFIALKYDGSVISFSNGTNINEWSAQKSPFTSVALHKTLGAVALNEQGDVIRLSDNNVIFTNVSELLTIPYSNIIVAILIDGSIASYK